MKVLVTGASGSVGQLLVPMLREKHEVVLFDRKDPGDGSTFIQGDVRDTEAVRKACEGVGAIAHLAAIFNCGRGRFWDAAGDEAAFAVNVWGTMNILEGAATQGVKRVVYTSSVMAGGNCWPSIEDRLPALEEDFSSPPDKYGLTKALGEKMCQHYAERRELSTLCLRPGPIVPTANYKPRYWSMLFGSVHAADVARAHALAVDAPEELRHGVYTIASDSPLNQVDPSTYKQDPLGTLEKLFPGIQAELTDDQKRDFARNGWFSIEAARRAFGYKPQYNFNF